MRKPLYFLIAATFALIAAAIGATTASGDVNAPANDPPGLVGPGPRLLNTSKSPSSYLDVAPCRIADTRATSALRPGASRTFVVAGTTGFTSQGGRSGGCAIPSSATSVTATITAVDSTGNGYLRAWAAGTREPNATALNFSPWINVSVGATLPLSAAGITVKAFGGSTDLVVDVTGYHLPPIFLVSYANATPVSSSRIVSYTNTGPGAYTVRIDTPVSLCAIQATSFGANFAAAYADVNRIFVETRSSGTKVNAYFQLTVTC